MNGADSDTALDVLLKAALAPLRGSETLHHADRPLGSLGAKIALAARLGLIDPAVEQSLRDSAAQARRNPLWQPMKRSTALGCNPSCCRIQ